MSSDGPEGRRPRLGAVILAGGLSERMGRPKALLPLPEGSTFLEAVAAAHGAAGVKERLVATFAALRQDASFPALPGVEVLVLPLPTPSPLDTLCAVLDRVEGRWHGFFVHPVDHPIVTPATLTAMARAFAKHGPGVVQPLYEDRGGHPVLLHADLMPEIRSAPRDQGLRAVVRSDPSRVLRLEVRDRGVIAGINTPEDYRRLFPSPPLER